LSQNIRIRGYENGDEEKIIELLKLVFNGWPQYDTGHSAIDTWNWKFGSELSKKTMGLAEDKDMIVGTFLTWIYNVKIGETIYATSNGCDVAVHPNYRGFGIFNKTRDLVGELRVKYGLKVHLGISGNPIVIQSYEKNCEKNPKTWIKFPIKINRMIMINDVDDFLRKNPTDNTLIKGIGYRTIKSSYKIMGFSAKNSKIQRSIKMRQISVFDDHIDEFWERIKNNYDFILERKKEYLNWRYNDPRSGYYRVTQAEENGSVLGYSVLRINRIKSDNPKGYIVELLSEPGKLDIVDALLGEAMKYFKESDINVVYASQVEGHPYSKVYKKYGFISYSKNSMFLWLTEGLGEDINTLVKTKVDRTHISNGDEDEV
jgi:hypothetical protein